MMMMMLEPKTPINDKLGRFSGIETRYQNTFISNLLKILQAAQ